jgi:outer membrane protein OmpA-like peptidoglycan-associated protein
MKTRTHRITLSRTLVSAAVASALLVACATAPVKPPGAAEVRSKLTLLEENSQLAGMAPVALKEAEEAVVTAEMPEPDSKLAAHRVFVADRKVETARALSETRFSEDQRASLADQREKARLDARTREADAANRQATAARAEGVAQKLDADKARSEAEAAQAATLSAEQQSAELQRQLAELQAKPTDRGMVLTLGDVLFTTGRADLKNGAAGHLDKLVAFLNKYPDRVVRIEGYTDNVGTEESNDTLSTHRAESVKSYLMGQGIGAVRLTSLGRGESEPVADNSSASGRQQNRRVEVVIGDPPAAALK